MNIKNPTETVYKQILGPEYIRKTALNLAVRSIKLLENYERYKKIKKRKQLLFEDLRRIMASLKDDVKKMDMKVPAPKGIEQKEKAMERTSGVIAKLDQREHSVDRSKGLGESPEEKNLTALSREAQQIRTKLETLDFK